MGKKRISEKVSHTTEIASWACEVTEILTQRSTEEISYV